MKSLIATIAGLTVGMLFAAEVPPVQVITFSTQGPDKYADGSLVLDGECYALVWSSDGVFEGIGVDGKALDENDKVVYIGEFAKDGKCDPVAFQIADDAFAGGAFELWVLDTRVIDNGVVTKVGKTSGVVTRAAKATAAVVKADSSAPSEATGIEGGAITAVPSINPADVPLPKIAGIAFDRDASGNEVVVLEIENTRVGVNYTVESGDTPSMYAAAEGKVTSGNNGKIKVIVPKRGDTGFFKGKVK